jgi:hypothetical protein
VRKQLLHLAEEQRAARAIREGWTILAEQLLEKAKHLILTRCSRLHSEGMPRADHRHRRPPAGSLHLGEADPKNNSKQLPSRILMPQEIDSQQEAAVGVGYVCRFFRSESVFPQGENRSVIGSFEGVEGSGECGHVGGNQPVFCLRPC